MVSSGWEGVAGGRPSVGRDHREKKKALRSVCREQPGVGCGGEEGQAA